MHVGGPSIKDESELSLPSPLFGKEETDFCLPFFVKEERILLTLITCCCLRDSGRNPMLLASDVISPNRRRCFKYGIKYRV